MSKLCSGVLRNKGNDEQGEAESQKREIAHAQQVGGAWGGGHLAKGVTDDHGCRGAITRLLTLLSFQKALGWITTPRTWTRELRHVQSGISIRTTGVRCHLPTLRHEIASQTLSTFA